MPGRAPGAGGEQGMAMVALLVAMAVIAVALSTALPVYQTEARREREAELVFRGEQYGRAIALFQRKYPNALPPDVDVLIKERFLRKKYKDPVTGDDFNFLGPASPELAEAMGTPPEGAAAGQSDDPGARGGARGRGAPTAATRQTGGQDPRTQAGRASAAQAAGGIMAVASKSKDASFRVYNGKTKYNEWLFMALQGSLAAGAPPGSGELEPGGRRGTSTPGARGSGPSPGSRGRGSSTGGRGRGGL